MTELDRRLKVQGKKQSFRSSSVKHGLAKLLIFYFTTRDRPLSKPHGPWPAGVGGPWNPKHHWIPPTLRQKRDLDIFSSWILFIQKWHKFYRIDDTSVKLNSFRFVQSSLWPRCWIGRQAICFVFQSFKMFLASSAWCGRMWWYNKTMRKRMSYKKYLYRDRSLNLWWSSKWSFRNSWIRANLPLPTVRPPKDFRS